MISQHDLDVQVNEELRDRNKSLAQHIKKLEREARHQQQERNQLREMLEIAIVDGPKGYKEWVVAARDLLDSTEENDDD